MDREELIKQIKRIMGSVNEERDVLGAYAEVREFLRTYAGPKSSFLKTLEQYDPLN